MTVALTAARLKSGLQVGITILFRPKEGKSGVDCQCRPVHLFRRHFFDFAPQGVPVLGQLSQHLCPLQFVKFRILLPDPLADSHANWHRPQVYYESTQKLGLEL